jgi:hypothetical protein
VTNHQQAEVITVQELDHLSEVREVCQTVETAGWRRILEQMKAFVDEAQEEMIGAAYASAEIKAGLQTRWQQRISMLRGVEKYISGLQFERQMLIEQSKPSVPREEYAEPDREIA